MSDFFATLAGKEDEETAGTESDDTPSSQEVVSEESEPRHEPEPAQEPQEEDVSPSPQPEEPKEALTESSATGGEDGGPPRAVLTMAKKKKEKRSNKKKKDEPEGQLTVDVYQTDDEIVVKSTIAGVDADNLDISITEDTVTIRGERDEEETASEEDYYYRELYWGSFSRSIILPVEVDPDEADAALKDGVLTIRIPKSSRSKERKVSVKKV